MRPGAPVVGPKREPRRKARAGVRSCEILGSAHDRTASRRTHHRAPVPVGGGGHCHPTPLVEDAHGHAWMAAVALRIADHGHRRRHLRIRRNRIRRVGARSLACACTRVARATDRASARAGVEGSMSEWSDPVPVEAGLLREEDWQATFVGPAWDEDLESPQPCPYLRRAFEITKPVTRARLVRDRARRVRARAQRAWCQRPRARTRMDQLPPPPPLRHLRRHRAVPRRSENVLGGIVGDGWFRGALVENLPTEPLRRPVGPALSARADPPRRFVDGRRHRFRVAGDDGADPQLPACTKVRPTTHAWS